MGAFFTWTSALISKLAAVTFTHSLSHTPGSMIGRIFQHAATASMTAVPGLLTMGTNVASFGALGDTCTVDIEIQMPHSIIQ